MHLLHRSCFVASLLTLAAVAGAQNRSGPIIIHLYSIDWHSVSVGPHTGITSGTLLFPAGGAGALGPLGSPNGGLPAFGLDPSCWGAPGGTPCPVDIDGISVGNGGHLAQSSGVEAGLLRYSVDPFAIGTVNLPGQPGLASEAAAMDAAADLLTHVHNLPPGPLGPGVPVAHRGSTDGNGLRSTSTFTYPGLGLIEPCPPVIGNPAYTGDNLDAITFPSTFVPTSHFYFSLEGSITDPLTGIPSTGSAQAHGFQGADVLHASGSGTITLFADAASLGLDLVQGPGSDDVDAIEVYDYKGAIMDGIYTAPTVLFQWETGESDLVLFSVRRGSAVIGQIDSLLGIPIQESDILMPPIPGGLSPFPGIFIAGERLGLASVRAGTASGNFSDDLDGFGNAVTVLSDCNHDGLDDIVQIGTGALVDGDGNGFPDDCQSWLVCDAPINISTGLPALLSRAFSIGSGSGLRLDAHQGPPNQFGYFLIGSSSTISGIMIGQGRLCLSTHSPDTIGRYNVTGSSLNSIGVFNAAGALQNLAGTSSTGIGFDVPAILPNSAGTIAPGSYWHFQLWHRDLGGQSNFSDTLRVIF